MTKMTKYTKIRIVHVDGHIQRHKILTKRKSEYKRIKRGVYGKIKRVIAPPIPVPPEIPTPEGNTKAIAFLKIADYGTDGHFISFECWVSRVFAPDETHKIDNWYEDSKEYMRDRLLGYFDDPTDEPLISQIIFGLELRKQSTTDSIGSTGEDFKYKHKEGWKKF